MNPKIGELYLMKAKGVWEFIYFKDKVSSKVSPHVSGRYLRIVSDVRGDLLFDTEGPTGYIEEYKQITDKNALYWVILPQLGISLEDKV